MWEDLAAGGDAGKAVLEGLVSGPDSTDNDGECNDQRCFRNLADIIKTNMSITCSSCCLSPRTRRLKADLRQLRQLLLKSMSRPSPPQSHLLR